MKYLIDAHAHLDSKEFDSDREKVLNRARLKGVKKIINVGSSIESSLASIRLAQKYPAIYAAVGIHPHESETASIDDFKSLEKTVKSSKVVAIGECGLDFFKPLSSQKKNSQIRLFKNQLTLAEKYNLPVIIHSREAFDETLAVLKKFKVKTVFHCWSYGPKEAKKAIRAGHFISFTGIVTYPKAKNVQSTAATLPIDSFWLETDCPLLAPQNNRGERNEPVFVYEIAQKIAWLRKKKLEEIIFNTTKNAERFFGF